MLTDEQLKKFHEFFEQKLKPTLEENRDEILKLSEEAKKYLESKEVK